MTACSLLMFPFFAAFAHAAPVKSGHATAEWITGATTVEGGKPIQTGIRMVIEDGWHSYWTNPGESGMKLKVMWDLPEGWTAGEVQHPAPKKFLTGELPGYGYEGEVIFPVTLTPPAGASGTVRLGAKVSWLTCNDASCIPGKAELKLSAASGSPENAAAIEKARALVPRPLEGLKLEVAETADAVALTLEAPQGFDATGWEVFPATEMALDHYKAIEFRKDGGKWTATAKKNAYADGPLKDLVLVLVRKGETPLEVAWKAK
ncbi:protein-disulfide reductase DsbD family protein [Luteolibacter sp. SL250]|uniref:protein-disulfide reductase DsbD domain-containing protein n=1 Tax=Luteolibacter sp. SL250 TaxID=2995170 RepID=UPI00226FD9D8|nr:protein-disulfide reductase DsbD domain-containing protein [Luteolibacter sp. SL250]WAC20355.1 protein-disulfide reductase DsbD family protein [Luteolibacter sp. SL250]